MELHDLVILTDIIKLPKEDLKDICIESGLDDSGTTIDLARSIWRYADTSEKKEKLFKPYYNKFFAGQTSITWFRCDNLQGLSEQIIQKEEVNPFEKKIPYSKDEISTVPKLRSASKITSDSYFLRFIYKDGTKKHFTGEDIEILPSDHTATVYINEKEGLIEVRAKSVEAQKIAEVISGYIKQQLSLHRQDFIKPFGYNIDTVAETLEGVLYESKASPELWMDNCGQEENEAILKILSALDNYFEDNDIGKLQDHLDTAKQILGDELLETPFIAIILAGMGNVGLKVDEKDLRNTAFYQMLKPYLQPSGGYIRFNVTEKGLTKEYSISIGIQTKSIYFKSKATTEEVIKTVRDKLIIS
ncbi:hypothetical protein [Bacillus velezensis]|uniref:hypothetical protein n=1 Tax=Bacillus velezensis TaxID=492670 RepID=UPI00295E2E81|nr:hypothetical protein [Bacillus velezensis]MDW0355033.1 hypothetical protein [Bacillus velezensis]MEE1863439.1 hypothetical protein [Bacillus velezensis]